MAWLKRRLRKRLGLFFMALAVVLNPWIIEFLFSPDRQLDFLYYYVIIILMELLLAFVGYSFYKKRPRKANWVMNLAILISTILVLLIIIEIVSYIQLRSQGKFDYYQDLRDNNMLMVREDGNVGYTLKPNMNTELRRWNINGTPVYSYNVSTNSLGMRTVGLQDGDYMYHLLLLGGSYSFGEGLEDNETLDHYFSEALPEYRTYNYGIFGYGPNNILAMFRKRNISAEVKQSKGIALYFFIEDHINRVKGRESWSGSSPYFTLDKAGMPKSSGSFDSEKPLSSLARKVFYYLRFRLYLLRVLNLYPDRITDADLSLTVAIIREIDNEYQKQFDGDFVVVMHPVSSQRYYVKIMRMLKEQGVTVISPDYMAEEDDIIPMDGHPSGDFNSRFGPSVIESLTRKNLLMNDSFPTVSNLINQTESWH